MSVLSTKNGFAIVYIKENRFSTTEMLFKQGLKDSEKASDSKNCKTFEIVNHLGVLEVLKIDFIAAEYLLLYALVGIEK